MIIPTPIPRIIPPNTAANRTSLVRPGTGCRIDTHTDKDKIEKSEEKTKVLPICLYPRKRKGKV